MKNKPPYPAASIANFFVHKAENESEGRYSMTLMHMQKLIYFAHGFHFGLFDSPLIQETFETWDYGPVVPTLYRKFRNYGEKRIDEKTKDDSGTVVEEPKDEQTVLLLNDIWRSYGNIDGMELSRMTYAKGSPWDQTLETLPNGRRAIILERKIPNETIRNYFKGLLSQE